MTPPAPLPGLAADRAIAVVRAPAIPDAAALCAALAEGGIRWVEFTFTTPGVAGHLRRAAAGDHGCRIGAGTVLTAAQAEEALDAGAGFLVTPGLRPEVAAVAHRTGTPVVLGALTPTEVAAAVDLGAAAVKLFPARTFGPRYLRDLHGPYPGVPFVASGGVSAADAADYLEHGATAVTAGTEVVPPAAVAAGDWTGITRRARAFTAALPRTLGS
ncbi:bifunctional 4-hydroxy-2-oxoglutarate aldolase/2-dehydro-3-deoxy-phosphogluconate aldolase [Peterkaempfera bronchialis]|uniref:Bifunctional 4-hydroxy-2-oxoglutarate aldolase/2-dehydro-3-deoxy-phosphogluconate aldolase n=1 Tax=Peterkaempfera bronchialis TaxID=2126346 RepID=A0A345T4M1_9ACTN|nr:bifunctional 4-hydroxy-2-oxoglutarate aldolase/2-dehydro-3-deoxy-phosphogluconate aldolase [Peterkaempfera bronchialis]AXI80926.1 bifunctional 4-hydroxy-2-oxoglutarate aldolase/2-dehydro-3-deoxy-phosphogluconate aldolase [Peterkaempfera bronchialis]